MIHHYSSHLPFTCFRFPEAFSTSFSTFICHIARIKSKTDERTKQRVSLFRPLRIRALKAVQAQIRHMIWLLPEHFRSAVQASAGKLDKAGMLKNLKQQRLQGFGSELD